MDKKNVMFEKVTVRDSLPMAVPVYVQCDGARFLAYIDEGGTWRYFYGQERVVGKVSRLPYGI